MFKWVTGQALGTALGARAVSGEGGRIISLDSKSECRFSVSFCLSHESDDSLVFADFKAYLTKVMSEFIAKRLARKKLKDNNEEAVDMMPQIALTSNNIDRIFALPRAEFLEIRKFQLPSPVSGHCKIELSVSHESVYFAGNYCKYSRYISQTPYITVHGT